MCSVLFDVYDGRVNTHARPVHTDCHANTGVKVEMKRRWNYKIPWAPYKIFWAPYSFGGPSKICMSKRIYQLFSENINKLITKENIRRKMRFSY